MKKRKKAVRKRTGVVPMQPGETVEYDPTTGAVFRYPSINVDLPKRHRNLLDILGDFVIDVLGAFDGIIK